MDDPQLRARALLAEAVRQRPALGDFGSVLARIEAAAAAGRARKERIAAARRAGEAVQAIATREGMTVLEVSSAVRRPDFAEAISFIWGPEGDDAIRLLWGVIPASAVAALMGVGKGSVMGRSARIGLSKPRSEQARGALKRDRKLREAGMAHTRAALAVRAASKPPQPRPQPQPPAPVVPAIVFQPRASRPCAYPIGEPGQKGFRFCDAPSLAGRSYCDEHHRLCTISREALHMGAQHHGPTA